MQLWSIEFTSDKFPPILPEPCQTNDDLYGFELATWLAETLARQGIVTSYPRPEEFGWFLEFPTEAGQDLTIGCASHGPAQGYPTQWRIFIRQRRRPAKGGEDATPALTGAILSSLAAEGIEARQL